MHRSSPVFGFLERLPLARDRPAIGHAVALAVSLAALALRIAFDRVLPAGFPYLTFFPAVVGVAFLFGLRPGIVAALLCGGFAWTLFIARGQPLTADAGRLVAIGFYAFVVTVDLAAIHWMQRATARLAAERTRSQELAETRALLFAELQHRISNNLQVVAALLALQKRDVTDPAARAALDDAARRLAVIGRLQRQLHDPEGGRLGAGAFLEQLVADAAVAGGREKVRRTVTAEPGIALAPDAAIPIALIVAEAVANAMEHGFRDRDDCHLQVSLRRLDGERLQLDVRDDGCGLPKGFDAEAGPSLGLRIATTLARQIGGSFQLLPADGSGTVARLQIPG